MQRKLLPIISVATWWICATLTYAATLSASGELGSHPKIAGTVQSTVWLSKQTPENGSLVHTIVAELTLPVADLNATFVVNENNIGDYGAEWNDVLEWAASLITGESEYGSYKTLVNWVYNGAIDDFGDTVIPQSPGGPVTYPDGQYLDFWTPVEFTFEYLARPQVSLRWSVTGHGEIVPEPSAVALLICAAIAACLRRRHGSIASTRASRS